VELVYLWVEKYKNIENQGFNFSPRFECKYEDGVLDIKDKEETGEPYLKDFFGENINVTAIVGENGSGKSSIIEIISSLILNQDIENDICFSILLNDEIFCFTNVNDLKIQYHSYEIHSLEDMHKYDVYSVFYSSNFTNGSLNSILELFTTPLHKTHRKSDFSGRDHAYKNDNLKIQSLLNLLFNSSRIIDTHSSESAYRQKHSFTIREQLNNYESAKVIIILQFFKLFGKNYLPLNIHNNDKVVISIQINHYTTSSRAKSFIDKIIDLLKLETEFYDDDEKEQEYYRHVETIKYNQAVDSILKFLNKYTDNLNSNEYFVLNITESLEFITLYIDLYRLNKHLNNSIFNFKFKNLSSGEENLVLMFAMLERGVRSYMEKESENNNYNILLMLDEIENNFHAEWQKVLFNWLLNFLNVLINHFKSKDSKKINFSILLASHSPFILSDLPKENVLFLEKYKEDDEEVKNENQVIGNCKNATKDVNINPFGANIHTLLSHGFFMEKGLMGEFAKGKINQIKEFYDDVIKYKDNKDELVASKCIYDDKKDEFWKIQEIIGEPFLKTIMGNYLLEIEKILFEEKAKENEIDRFIEKFGKNELQKHLDSRK
jgi:ABC-type dipeptide/oligopeptide/nickel transport system ATPase component